MNGLPCCMARRTAEPREGVAGETPVTHTWAGFFWNDKRMACITITSQEVGWSVECRVSGG